MYTKYNFFLILEKVLNSFPRLHLEIFAWQWFSIKYIFSERRDFLRIIAIALLLLFFFSRSEDLARPKMISYEYNMMNVKMMLTFVCKTWRVNYCSYAPPWQVGHPLICKWFTTSPMTTRAMWADMTRCMFWYQPYNFSRGICRWVVTNLVSVSLLLDTVFPH